jgi:hypothetical protein
MKKSGMQIARIVETFGSPGAIAMWPIAFAEALGGNTIRWNTARLGGLLTVVSQKQSFRYLRAFAAHCNIWFVALLEGTIDEDAVLRTLATFRVNLHLEDHLPDPLTIGETLPLGLLPSRIPWDERFPDVDPIDLHKSTLPLRADSSPWIVGQPGRRTEMELQDFETLARGELLSDGVITAVVNTAVVVPDVLVGRPNWYGNLYESIDHTTDNPADPITELHRR